MRTLFVLSLIVSLSIAPGFAGAGQGREDPYTVDTHDVLYVGVWAGGELELTQTVEVSSYGTIPFFFFGEVEVAGLTTREIRDVLTNMLARGYYKDPVVIVKINAYRSKEVMIQGAVARPGTFHLDTNTTTLLKLLSMAGGALDERGDFAYIYREGIEKARDELSAKEKEEGGDETEEDLPLPVSLRSEQFIEVPLKKLLEDGQPQYDQVIYPGDFVYVRAKKQQSTTLTYIWVEGQGVSSRQIEYQEGLTALQAVIRAGGLRDTSAPNRAKIVRIHPDGSQEIIRVKLKKIRKGKKPDIPLKPGDRLVVPESIF